jgi:hypothetical protein
MQAGSRNLKAAVAAPRGQSIRLSTVSIAHAGNAATDQAEKAIQK